MGRSRPGTSSTGLMSCAHLHRLARLNKILTDICKCAGRVKIPIAYRTDDRARRVTLCKRKKGLYKKAEELAVSHNTTTPNATKR